MINDDIFVISAGDNAGVTLQGNACAPAGHKIALKDIKCGENVIKYGAPIGVATCDIKAGDWVHSHNLATGLGANEEYVYEKLPSSILPSSDLTFEGYKRKNGKVGTRNDLWIIAAVGCINGIVRKAAEELAKFTDLSVVPVTHPYGCSTLGEDSENTMKVLAALATHPNAGGAIIVGLGCENCNLGCLKPYIDVTSDERVRYINLQDSAGDVEDIVCIGKELLGIMQKDKRQVCKLSDLTIAVKCGGSDGYSGITANAIIGGVTDVVCGSGGKALMSEVPEMFGSEKRLMNRCKDRSTFEKLVSLINGFKDYYRSFGEPVGENPSPGNKAGGITTLEEKSLGCTVKSGKAEVVDVLEYGKVAQESGLSLVFSPGNDLVSLTSMTASGATIALFSTGRGTPFGGLIPTIKIASNSALAAKKPSWIDLDGGRALQEGNAKLSKELLELTLAVASGKTAKNELNSSKDIAIFKRGVTL